MALFIQGSRFTNYYLPNKLVVIALRKQSNEGNKIINFKK